MDNIDKDPQEQEIDTRFTSLKDCAATQRALDYYLKPTVSEWDVTERLFDVNRHVSSEEALVHASCLLRCAAASANESANSLQGASRDLALTVVHMIDMAKAMVERSLDGNRAD